MTSATTTTTTTTMPTTTTTGATIPTNHDDDDANAGWSLVSSSIPYPNLFASTFFVSMITRFS